MADVLIDGGLSAVSHYVNNRCGPFWTSTTTCYVVYINSGGALEWNKSTDGGANWDGAVGLVNSATSFDCWADWQTTGDAGTIIHIVAVDYWSDDILYFYIDTSDDSTGSDTIEVCQGNGAIGTTFNRYYVCASITKTRGGNILVAVRYRDTANAIFDICYTSPDGDTWTSRANPWEAVNSDYILLFPANLADDQDAWAAFWDASSNGISLKTFDDSGNSWSEQAISGGMNESSIYSQWGTAIRQSDGHLLLAAWTQLDNAAADLKTWDITDAGTITAKTDVLTNSAESCLAAMLIDQNTDRVYVVYVRGTAFGSQVKTFYKYSDDGMATWSAEQAMQADAEEDIRWVGAGAVKAAWGGKFMPIWFDDDDNDLFCNTDNAISIAAAGAGWTGEVFKVTDPAEVFKKAAADIDEVFKVGSS